MATKSKSNKSTANPLLRRRQERNKGRGNSEPADWESPKPELIAKLIATVTIQRGTVTFGYTRDGGAYYINYYLDGESEKIYIRPTEDIDLRLADEIESWNF